MKSNMYTKMYVNNLIMTLILTIKMLGNELIFDRCSMNTFMQLKSYPV